MKHSKLDPRGNPYLVPLFLVVVVMVLFMRNALLHEDMVSFYILLAIVAIIVVPVVLNATVMITVTPGGVSSKGLFKRKMLFWQDIRQFGVVVYGPRSRYLLPREDWDKGTFPGTKYIFLTGSSESPLNLRWRSKKNWIMFNYSPDAVKEIEIWMRKKGI